MLLFIDTETSGLYKFKEEYHSPNQPHLVQLALILDDMEGNTVEEYETVIRVGDVNIPPSAAEIHGITTAIANSKGIAAQVALEKFNEMWKVSNCIIAHNISFDINIMLAEFYRENMDNLFKMVPTYCTMKHSTDLLKLPGKYGYKWPTLSEAYRVLIDVEGFEGAHSAMVDTRACRKVYYALKALGR